MNQHIKHNITLSWEEITWNCHILGFRMPGITPKHCLSISQNCTLKVLKNEVQLYADSCLNPSARRTQCLFFSQGRWQRLIEQNSPSCPSQITTKHLISIPLSVPFLLCSSAVHQHSGAALEAGRGRKDSVWKGRRNARNNERVRKGRQDGKEEKWQS